MDVADVLSIIVERACIYAPEPPVGVTNVKRPKAFTEMEKFPKEKLIKEVVPNEELSVVKVPAASVASDFVRIKRNCIEFVCLKLLGLPTCLA